MFCSKCGKEIADGSRFCPECGTQFGPIADPASATTATVGTRDQTGIDDLVYPKNPPISPNLGWFSFVLPGAPLIMFGQTAKGIAVLVLGIASLLFAPLTVAVRIAAIVDAIQVGKVLRAGRTVKKWAWFPK